MRRSVHLLQQHPLAVRRNDVDQFALLYDSFTTGVLGQTLAEADFRFQGSGMFTLSLLSNNPNDTPGAVIYSEGFLANPGMGSPPPVDPSSLYVQEFFPQSEWLLSAKTRYWIELSSSPGPFSDLAWSYAAAPGAGTAKEFWADSSGVFPNGEGTGPFQINLGNGGVLIPEPAAWILMAVGFVGLALLGVRNRLASA